MPVLKTTSPGRFTFAPNDVPSNLWPSLRTSVAWTGASQGLDGPPSTPSMRDLCFHGLGAAVSRACDRRAGPRFRGRAARRAAARALRLQCRERSVRRARRARRPWPRAPRLAFVRARLFQNAGGARAARVALITKLVRRAAARGRARVEHGAAAVGLHLCWRLYWFRSLWLAAGRELGAVTSSGCSGTTGALRRSPAVPERAQRSNRRPPGSQSAQTQRPERTCGEFEQATRELLQESSGTALSGLAAGCCSRPGFGRPSATACLETHCSTRLARAVFRSPR